MRREEEVAILIVAQIDLSQILWGPPGQGKSRFVRVGFGKLGYLVRTVRVNTILPHHLSGFPVPDAASNVVKLLPPEWVLELNAAEKAVLFLDDISAAMPTGQLAALGVLDEREVGGVKLNAVPIGAANPDSLATARFALDAAAANRCVHIDITSDSKRYRDGMLNDFPAPDVPQVRAGWRQLVRGKAELITRFLDSPDGRGVLNKMPEQITSASRAWPSERSWDMAMQCLAACDSLVADSVQGVDLGEVRRLLFEGCVGHGAYQKFVQSFLKPVSVDVNLVLQRGRAFNFPERGDEIYALLWSISDKIRTERSKNNWERAWQVLEGAMATSHRDRCVTFALDLVGMSSTNLQPPEFYEKTVRPFLEQVAA